MKIVHCKKEPYDIYIGRPSEWGNPFVVGEHGTRTKVLKMYREWIKNQPHLLEKLPTLKGKILGCWCKPLPCHGDILLELIDD